MKEAAPHVLIVDNDEGAQSLMQSLLVLGGYRASCASSVSQATLAMEYRRPDLLLLDWQLPDLSGPAFVRRLRRHARLADLAVILVTGRSSVEDAIVGLESGADDYITKPVCSAEFLARVRAVLRGRAPHLSNNVVQIARLRLDPASGCVTSGDSRIPLSGRDFQLLHYFMTHADRVFTRTALLDRIWGEHAAILERNIDVHIRRLRRALAQSSCAGWLKTVRGAGYVFGRARRPQPGRLPIGRPSSSTDCCASRG
jgi:two-component system phosphate regulon response regulator PhoB